MNIIRTMDHAYAQGFVFFLQMLRRHRYYFLGTTKIFVEGDGKDDWVVSQEKAIRDAIDVIKAECPENISVINNNISTVIIFNIEKRWFSGACHGNIVFLKHSKWELNTEYLASELVYLAYAVEGGHQYGFEKQCEFLRKQSNGDFIIGKLLAKNSPTGWVHS